LYLRRRYTFYVMNVIVPCILLSVLVMVGFCLPPDATTKRFVLSENVLRAADETTRTGPGFSSMPASSFHREEKWESVYAEGI